MCARKDFVYTVLYLLYIQNLMHRCTVDNLYDIQYNHICIYVYIFTQVLHVDNGIYTHAWILGISNVVGISRFLAYNLKS